MGCVELELVLVCVHGMWCTKKAQIMDKLRNMDCGIKTSDMCISYLKFNKLGPGDRP